MVVKEENPYQKGYMNRFSDWLQTDMTRGEITTGDREDQKKRQLNRIGLSEPVINNKVRPMGEVIDYIIPWNVLIAVGVITAYVIIK